MEKDVIINRVAASPLVTIDLEEYFPEGESVVYDLRHNLYQDMILKEKDFREFIKTHDWTIYQDKNVAICCTTDAIVPMWAFMLVATKLSPYAKNYVFGELNMLEAFMWKEKLQSLHGEDYINSKVVIKGCGQKTIPAAAYVEVVRILQPYVASIMFGEPCSTVPVYKKSIK